MLLIIITFHIFTKELSIKSSQWIAIDKSPFWSPQENRNINSLKINTLGN